jgi:hypothetical protein
MMRHNNATGESKKRMAETKYDCITAASGSTWRKPCLLSTSHMSASRCIFSWRVGPAGECLGFELLCRLNKGVVITSVKTSMCVPGLVHYDLRSLCESIDQGRN